MGTLLRASGAAALDDKAGHITLSSHSFVRRWSHSLDGTTFSNAIFALVCVVSLWHTYTGMPASWEHAIAMHYMTLRSLVVLFELSFITEPNRRNPRPQVSIFIT